MTAASDNRAKFLALLHAAVVGGTLVKLTLGKHRGADATLRNLFVRPVSLKNGPHFTFVWRHATRDVTRNFSSRTALAEIEPLLGPAFLDAHLFTTTQSAQLECQADGGARLRIKAVAAPAAQTTPPSRPFAHDRPKIHPIPAAAPWLRALGVTNDQGRPREGMADKHRQIQKFSELLARLLAEAELPQDRPLRIVDMGSGKGYLTFALAQLLGDRADITGIEARPELVDLCNRVARENNFPRLRFACGQIESAEIGNPAPEVPDSIDVLIALHACDTATDDALARGIAAGTKLLVVAPCCQKELRAQLTAPPVLAAALRHGIVQERQAEFVTDALRAMLLEWAGYKTKVFEFISTEHTAKNLMIVGIKCRVEDAGKAASGIRDFAAFYGIRSQTLARRLRFDLAAT